MVPGGILEEVKPKGQITPIETTAPFLYIKPSNRDNAMDAESQGTASRNEGRGVVSCLILVVWKKWKQYWVVLFYFSLRRYCGPGFCVLALLG